MRTLYYVEEKETEKEEKLNFEFVTSLKHVSVYEIKGTILEEIHFVRMLIDFDTEAELIEDLLHKGKINNAQEINLVKL